VATLKKYDLAGGETGSVNVDQTFSQYEANGQMIKDYIVAIRKNARQWSASTRERNEISHSTQKPHKQKGTGKARQGSLSSPQYKGGGIVFGPKPKFDQHVRINKKERRAAIRHLLAERMREGRMIVLDGGSMDAPKTQTVSRFLENVGLSGRTLFLGEGAVTVPEGDKVPVNVRSNKHTNLVLSLRNIPKVAFSTASKISGYDVALAGNVVVTEGALSELLEWLKPTSKKEAVV
jgi:large subunit ribosomal protein L4